MVNFIFLAATTEAGSASIEGGKYVLTEHGKLVRELTEPEYTDFRAKQVRAFSGHWLVFYFVPFAYFMFRARAALPDEGVGLHEQHRSESLAGTVMSGRGINTIAQEALQQRVAS
jgi:hypothetical protein